MKTGRVLAGAAGLAMAIAAVATNAAASTNSTFAITSAPGKQVQVQQALGRSALRVQRRHGRVFQVTADNTRVDRLRRLPGVVEVRTSPVAIGDQGRITSQGILRTGAAQMVPAANGGQGLVIAVLDLGFGNGMPALQAAGELPPPANLQTISFDAVHGLAGRNAYGNATNHGELVAQTVFDYVPRAQYVFVNYRTEQDFVTAVDWLIQRRPDIVVHSNSFIEGPFDGTSIGAQAVNRAADAGILWFNSAGNYQRRMWKGAWVDADGDGAADYPVPDGGIFYRNRGNPITFAVTWRSPSEAATDLDLVIERREDDGSAWVPVASSNDRQTIPGATTSERVVGYLPRADGFFRVRIQRVAGPPPAGHMTLVSREIAMSLFGGTIERTIPTPGDAAGAIAVGAVDWRGDRFKDYSSIGPTDDGRIKPDMVAPTDTVVAGPSGSRMVGGTSNAAPNAAGAAAVVMATLRRQGRPSTAADLRVFLTANAVDLGDPGPDMAFGAGRVRVERTGPRIIRRTPAGSRPVRGVVPLTARAVDPSDVVRLEVGFAGRVRARASARDQVSTRLDTRNMRDGRYLAWVEATDWAGNTTRQERQVRIDNTRPRIQIARIQRASGRPTQLRPSRLVLRIRDGGGGAQQVRIWTGGRLQRTVRLPAGRLRAVPIGNLRKGSVRVQVQARDRAGNVRTVRRTLTVR